MLLRRALALPLALTLHASCVSEVAPTGSDQGEIAQAVKVCPGSDRVEGIDVSYYQPDIDWAAVKASGREFAIIRVSDGLGTIDTKFESHWAGAKQAGLIRSAYQYFRPAQSPTEQANLLLDKIGGVIEPGDLPPVIDMETASGLSGAQVTSAMQEWLDVVETKLGRKAIIYTGAPFWNNTMGNPPGHGDRPLWIAAYPYCYDSIVSGSYCPNIPDQWSSWTFWQYSDGANTPGQGCTTDPPVVPGVGQGCDRNIFNGTLAQLQALAGGGVTGPSYAAQFVGQSYPFASEPPVAAKVGEVLSGYIDLKNVGSKPWQPGVTYLAPIPRDVASNLAAPSWPKSTRVSTVEKEIAPGEVARFAWDLSPSQPGDFSPYFGLVHEGVTWFADKPEGGGPPDDQLQVRLTVAPGDPGSGGAAGAGGEGGSAGAGGGAAGQGGAATAGQGGAPGASGGAAGAGGTAAMAGATGTAGTASGGAGGAQSGASGASGKAPVSAGGSKSGESNSDGGTSQAAIVERDGGGGGDEGGCGCRVRPVQGNATPSVLLVSVLVTMWRRSQKSRKKR